MVTVRKGTVELTKRIDMDGKVEIEFLDASYNIEVTHGQFIKTDSISLTADTLKTFNLEVFIKFLGIGMSMIQFLLFITALSVFLAGLSETVIIKGRLRN